MGLYAVCQYVGFSQTCLAFEAGCNLSNLAIVANERLALGVGTVEQYEVVYRNKLNGIDAHHRSSNSVVSSARYLLCHVYFSLSVPDSEWLWMRHCIDCYSCSSRNNQSYE